MSAIAVLEANTDRGLRPAVPVMAVVFLVFLLIGMALPVLPLHVHLDLGYGTFVVGVVAGAQFLAALVSRLWAGRITDRSGPKRAVLSGLGLLILGGGCYFLSTLLLAHPPWAVAVLLMGRALVGAAESLVITGGILWGLGLVAPERAAKVIAWIGMAMFAALAVGAPTGSVIYARFGFTAIAALTAVLPLVALAVATALRPLIPVPADQGSIKAVFSAVLLPGIGFALSGITFGAMTAFLPLFFALRGWQHGALGFTAFAVALIATRIVAGHLPDKLGGARVAVWSLGIQTVGLLGMAFAPGPGTAMLAAGLAGVGFSLVFPGLGLEAVRRAPEHQRGLAMGIYNAFLDLTLGIGSPALGWLAAHAGLSAIFVASGIASAAAIPVAMRLSRSHGTGIAE